MSNHLYRQTGSRPAMTATLALVAAGIVFSTGFGQFDALKRARLTDAMNDVREVKLALDSFAMDNDGVYPGGETATFYDLPEDGKWSNDFFRQLFASGNSDSEKIFWVENSPIAAGSPDDVITIGGRFDPAETLKPGDVHWAYMTDQSSISNGARPLLLDCYKRNSSEFDLTLHGGKAVVMRIDGAALGMAIDAKGKIRDAQGEDLLSDQSQLWKNSRRSPAKLLKQPAPGTPLIWTDATGKRTIEAEFLDLKNGEVILRRTDGKPTKPIPLKDLSQADQKVAQELSEKSQGPEASSIATLLQVLERTQAENDALKDKNAELSAVAEIERAKAAALQRELDGLRKKQ